MIKYVPNSLTIFRIILVPVFIWFSFFYEPLHLGANLGLLTFVIASISDYFDGMLARKFDIISNFGKIMDPLADKFLVVAALFALALPPIKIISMAIVIIVIFREIAVTILRDIYARKGIYIPANIWGKLKTVTQMVGIVVTLIYNVIQYKVSLPVSVISNIRVAVNLYFWLVAVITILSGLNYFKVKSLKTG